MPATLPFGVRRAFGVHRRLLAACCAALASFGVVEALAPRPAPTVEVLAAARDLRAGAALTDDDLRAISLPAGIVPDGALLPGAAVLGRSVAGPVRRGEPLTDARLIGPSLLSGLSAGGDVVAVPVRLADADAVRLVRAGDRVDVLAAPVDADAADGSVLVVAASALVLATPDQTSTDEGSLLVVAVSAATAKVLARAATTSRLSVALRGAR